jgi:hypothetical protein
MDQMADFILDIENFEHQNPASRMPEFLQVGDATAFKGMVEYIDLNCLREFE